MSPSKFCSLLPHNLFSFDVYSIHTTSHRTPASYIWTTKHQTQIVNDHTQHIFHLNMVVTDDEGLQSVCTPDTPNTLTRSSRLAPDAMQALAEFMREKDEQDRRFDELRLQAERDHEDRIVTMADFQEDWNQSQVGRAEDWVGGVGGGREADGGGFSSGTTTRRRRFLRNRCSKALRRIRRLRWCRLRPSTSSCGNGRSVSATSGRISLRNRSIDRPDTHTRDKTEVDLWNACRLQAGYRGI